MIRTGTSYKELNSFHFGIYVTEDLIYVAVEPYNNTRSIYDVIRIDNIDGKKLIEYSKEFNKILSERDKALLRSEDPSKLRIKDFSKKRFEMNHVKNNLIFKKLSSTLFPYKYEIRIFGASNSGVSSILYKLFGLTISSQFQNIQIPLIKDQNGKHFLFKKFILPIGFEGYFDTKLPTENHILYIVDSTKKDRLGINISIRESLEKAIPSQKFLILANKQDLPDAISPEEIEKSMGYPTVGFSAIAPDAPERLEKIIADFLNNNPIER